MNDTRRLPGTPNQWLREIEANDLTNQTIWSAQLASASKIGYDQFLLLRVLWREKKIEDIRTAFGMQMWIPQAKEELASYESWSAYCNNIESFQKIPEGTFAIVRHCQLEVNGTKPEVDPVAFSTPIAHRTRAREQQRLNAVFADLDLADPETPTKKGKKLEGASPIVILGTPEDPFYQQEEEEVVKEEEVVVEEVVVVEDEVVEEEGEEEEEEADEPSPAKATSPVSRELQNILYPPTKDEQILDPTPKSIQSEVFKDASFEARTDGYLSNRRGKPGALIEVKPVIRARKSALIQMQENVQMVAWIKNDGLARKKPKTRFHISQDRNEIYVTIAEYDENYVTYLKNKPAETETNPSFLTMHQYGPWNTLDASHIRELGPILLAISLRVDAESQ